MWPANSAMKGNGIAQKRQREIARVSAIQFHFVERCADEFQRALHLRVRKQPSTRIKVLQLQKVLPHFLVLFMLHSLPLLGCYWPGTARRAFHLSTSLSSGGRMRIRAAPRTARTIPKDIVPSVRRECGRTISECPATVRLSTY